MEGRCEARVGWRVGMRAQRDHSRNCWSGLAVVDAIRAGLSGASWRAWAARVERVQKWVRSSSRAGYRLLRESR